MAPNEKREIAVTHVSRTAALLAALCLVIPAGLYSKVYSGPGWMWSVNYAGGIFYEIFFCIIAALVFPSAGSVRIGLSVFPATSALEFLQLWHPPFLEAVRSLWIGRTVIGTTFSPLDFPHYAAGCILGVLIISFIRRQYGNTCLEPES